MRKFALIGAAGYIAPRHFKAIKDTGNELVAALDRFDSVGIIDSYFPEADFFTEFERFDRHLEMKRHNDEKIDFVSICSPNYLHDAHIRFALRSNADAICEKPLVLNPWNVDALEKIEDETGRKVNTILQLRLHHSVAALKERIETKPKKDKYEIDLTYITSRGNWYFISWKGDVSKSGGIATNIGVHFYDMLGWLFGKVQDNIVHIHEADHASGYLEFEKARVRWFLSINEDHLPKVAKTKNLTTFRSLTIEGEEFEFSGGFTELHTESYKHILAGKGFSLAENRQAIEIVHQIRGKKTTPLRGDYHPWARKVSMD